MGCIGADPTYPLTLLKLPFCAIELKSIIISDGGEKVARTNHERKFCGGIDTERMLEAKKEKLLRA